MFSQIDSDRDKGHPKSVPKIIMQEFTTRTGLNRETGSDPSHRRYLWTDAFAVANYFQLSHEFQEEEEHFRSLALHLIDSVHNSLGKFRPDDIQHRAGQWLDGSSEHPTAAGLRIGKPLNEKMQGEVYDNNTEWDKDGQYFHYLIKWMIALDIATRRTGDTKFMTWALELASIATERFVYNDLGRPQMYWKMSIDLSRPQLPSQGATDPIDGYITISRLLSTCEKNDIHVPNMPKLFEAKRIFLSMVHILPSDDPLGLGGMLLDIYQLERLQQAHAFDEHNARLLRLLYQTSFQGMQFFVGGGELERPAEKRLAFRELGLSIGLHAIERLQRNVSTEDLLSLLPLAKKIELFWQDPTNQAAPSWNDHLDMNEVMLATSLDPDSWLWFGNDC